MKSFYILIFSFLISFSSGAQVPSFKAIIYDSSAVSGYFFLVSEGHLMILDKYGAAVYYKENQGNDESDFKIQPNGKMTYFNNGQFRLMDSTFKIVDSVACKNCETDFHEIKILPNDHILLMGLEKMKMDLSKYHLKGQQLSDTSKVISGVIQELDAGHHVAFEWHAKDHFAFDDMDTSRYSPIPLFIDWTHWNSLDVDRDGNILVSSRRFDEITKINRLDGSIIWRLGGKRNQFKFIDPSASGQDAEPFSIQRNIRVLPDGDITFLDRGVHGTRGVEFQLDEKNKTATLIWSYKYDKSMTSTFWGNVQRLSHYNTLIDFGLFFRSSSDLCFVIVDSSGNKLFELNGPHSLRAYYYDSLLFQLHRPQVTCFDSLGVTYLKTTKDYPSYQWSDSSATRSIPVSKPGSYSVFVPYGQGGFISSETLIVAAISHPCEALPIAKPKKNKK